MTARSTLAWPAFDTPVKLAQTLARTAARSLETIEPDGPIRVLEPSAGNGAIARALLDEFPSRSMTLVEKDEDMADRLAVDFPHARVIRGSFRKFHSSRSYHVIVMHPPFARVQDYLHTIHAWNLLAPYGVLISLISAASVLSNKYQYRGLRKLVNEYHGRLVVLDRAEHDLEASTALLVLRCDGRPRGEDSYLSSAKNMLWTEQSCEELKELDRKLKERSLIRPIWAGRLTRQLSRERGSSRKAY